RGAVELEHQPPCIGASTSTRSPSVSAACGLTAAATNSPLTAVATTAPPSPSSARRPESSAATVSRQAPLTRIFIDQLRKMTVLEEHGRRPAGERRGDQEAVAVQAV